MTINICNSRIANQYINHIFETQKSIKMKKHSGMRPHDIVILLKIAAKGLQPWLMKDLSQELNISASEISESLNRSAIAGLISQNKKRLMKLAILDFLEHGLKYVYPQQPGALVRGIPTAHSAPPLNNFIISEEPYVWPYGKGKVRGQSIVPLYPSVVDAVLQDEKLYELLALVDAVRVGRAREKEIAIKELKSRILDGE
jgi:predicted transcriptional regulator